MYLLDKLAEQNIEAAIERGELDELPGAGKPLELEDLSLIPETLRAGYLLLKNSGHLPPEMRLRKEIADLEQLIRVAGSAERSNHAGKRLRYLKLQLGMFSAGFLDAEERYQEPIMRRFDPLEDK